ncbi:MAG: RsmD family RNA methyltransferase, partial [Bacteroidota bacterium]|nr:RsmD family RNA methyltransferase [Bacteroidota bacterium]
MRIISGLNGGQKIIIPKNFNLRPTTDKSKEGIFNILSNYFDFYNVEVLDLFSGTGNMSYEFASRGAKYIRAVEINFKHYSFIKSEIKRMNLNIDVIKSDVFKYLNVNSDKFDIIFA